MRIEDVPKAEVDAVRAMQPQLVVKRQPVVRLYSPSRPPKKPKPKKPLPGQMELLPAENNN